MNIDQTIEQGDLSSTATSRTTLSPAMVVLGGNAFAGTDRPLTMETQFRFAESILRQLTPLFSDGRPVVITHGNGPQVGHMLTRVAAAKGLAYGLPLGVCVADTEGELGYVLQQTLHNVLVEAHIPRDVVSLLTQTVVDEHDPAFTQPTKAVGPVCDAVQTKQLEAQGICVREDTGKGLRRMVSSPLPVRIIETDIIRDLLAAGVVVIAAGGGGIPVTLSDGLLTGVDAVVDKDLASALLGNQLGALDMLTITDVPFAYQNFRTTSQKPIGAIDVASAKLLIGARHFAAGSMLPKMQAAVQFCARPGTRSIICSPRNLRAAWHGRSGTVIKGPDAAPDPNTRQAG